MDTEWSHFILGLLLGGLATIWSYEGIILEGTDDKLEICEKSLPRDRYCELIAVEATTE